MGKPIGALGSNISLCSAVVAVTGGVLNRTVLVKESIKKPSLTTPKVGRFSCVILIQLVFMGQVVGQNEAVNYRQQQKFGKGVSPLPKIRTERRNIGISIPQATVVSERKAPAKTVVVSDVFESPLYRYVPVPGVVRVPDFK